MPCFVCLCSPSRTSCCRAGSICSRSNPPDNTCTRLWTFPVDSILEMASWVLNEKKEIVFRSRCKLSNPPGIRIKLSILGRISFNFWKKSHPLVPISLWLFTSSGPRISLAALFLEKRTQEARKRQKQSKCQKLLLLRLLSFSLSSDIWYDIAGRVGTYF